MTQHLVNLQSELGLNFYNGGWIKTVSGIDKSKDNGYSLLGDFVGQGVRPLEPGLFLVCDVGGSRKNQEKHYTLVELQETGSVTNLAEVTGTSGYNRGKDGHDWAVRLWPTIDAWFAAQAAKTAACDPHTALRLEREHLVARLAEIDAALATI